MQASSPAIAAQREELDVDYAGDALSIGFNARYLLEALGTMKAKEVRFGLQNDVAPAQLVPTDDEESLAVVMPMRV